MNNQSINKEELSREATELLHLLERYASFNDSARNVLDRFSGLIIGAIQKNIEEPNYRGFLPEELWEDGELNQYSDLCDAAARFSVLLQGWNSLEEFRSAMKEVKSRETMDELELIRKNKEKK